MPLERQPLAYWEITITEVLAIVIVLLSIPGMFNGNA
jgi:hypothetical protein